MSPRLQAKSEAFSIRMVIEELAGKVNGGGGWNYISSVTIRFK
jgi:hypothetical protein